LGNDENGNSPLIEATRCSNPEVVKFILQHAPELLEKQNENGDTALMVALQSWFSPKESCEIIDLLIQAGASPAIKNKEGKDSFKLAKRYDQLNAQLTESLKEIANKSLLNSSYIEAKSLFYS
jgi:ankyrin repeat protein